MTERVIGQRRQAHHRVVPGQLPAPGVPDVARGPRADVLRAGAEIAPLIQAQVQSVDFVPGRAKDGDEHGPDVATIARNEDPHRVSPQTL